MTVPRTPGGWIVHFIVGILLALIYAWVFVDRLPGPPAARGAIYGALVFLVAQRLFMPLVGAGFFAHGDLELLIGSLLGHIVYGIVVGWIYHRPTIVTPVAAQLSNSRVAE